MGSDSLDGWYFSQFGGKRCKAKGCENRCPTRKRWYRQGRQPEYCSDECRARGQRESNRQRQARFAQRRRERKASEERSEERREEGKANQSPRPSA